MYLCMLNLYSNSNIKKLNKLFSMKKKLHLSLLCMLLALVSIAQPVNVEKASNVAKLWFNDVLGLSVSEALQCSYTANAKDNSTNYYYIFNDMENGAFVIVSADERVLPVLGYSAENSIDVNNIPVNMKDWLDGYVEEIKVIINTSSLSVHPEWEQISTHSFATKGERAVNPLISQCWDQGTYYNALCPQNCYTGCVATAMAMIMKYWEHPIHGYSSTSYYHSVYGVISADFGSTYYQWNQMPNYVNSPNTAVATLMFHCGVSVQMDYSSSGSGAYTENVPGALRQFFGYSPECAFYSKTDYQTTEWQNMVMAELDAARPMLYRGNSAASGGHAFICDGYNANNYFHFNWGWSCSYNSYFSLSNLNPGGYYNFNTDQGAVMNFEPDYTLYCNEPQNVTASISGTTVTVNWSAPETSDLELVQYQITADGNLIGTVETSVTSFTHENVGFGTHSYCVHSVYDNGCVSEALSCIEVEGSDCFAPSNLEATANGTTVTLSWTAPENAIVETYEIYRNNELLTSVTEPTYVDEEVVSGAYEYCVVAKYDNSHSSDPVCAETTVEENCIPPSDLNAIFMFGKYTLTWTAPEGKSLHGYNVYRNNEIIATEITETSYSDTPPSTVFTYGVSASYTSCESEIIEKVINVGIDEIYNNISIYPNPVDNILIVEGVNISNIMIFNAVGKKIADINLSEKAEIETSEFESGIYFLFAKDNNGIVKQYKFIVAH